MTPADDAALLAAHVDGDPDAFGRLVARHRDRLWAVALRTTGHPEDAADALQDALVSAYRQAGSFRGDSAVTTWLHRVVVNACLDQMRRNRVRAAVPLPDDLDDEAARGRLVTGPNAAARTGDPEHALLTAEVRARVRAALAELPPDQGAALALVDLEGLPVVEAATVLGVPVGTVKSRCSRGRARLAVLLADLVDPADPVDTVDPVTPPRPGGDPS
ncbi:MAG: polymerase, sigma subunit, family [Marmoricola sp.]|nr:polymerase, sigma subunit, family [Marmoricola sp.]